MDDLGTARTTALQELRAAEAARVLGLLDTTTLPAKAGRWIELGLATPAVFALAGGGSADGADTPALLLATLASEHGLSIHDPAVARAVHARAVIGMAGSDFSTSLVAFSNSVTDGLTGRLRRWFRGGR